MSTEIHIPADRARAVRFDRFGDLDVLHVDTIDRPVPGPGEALVGIRAAGINPGEAAIRRGDLAEVSPSTFPSGEGSDLAGIVLALGPDTDDSPISVGDEVLGYSWTRSSHATHAVVPLSQLTPKPEQLSWEVAGSLYVVGATAWAAVEAVDPQPGETVAVSAAAGGVGSIVVQLLAGRGTRVLAIASERNADWLTALGAEPLDYAGDLAGRLRAAAPQGIDAFVDCHGHGYVRLAADLGVDPQRIDTIIDFAGAGEVGAKTDGSVVGSRPEVMAELTRLVAAGELEVPIAATYPLDRVADAFAELADGHTHGKIVLLPWPPAVPADDPARELTVIATDAEDAPHLGMVGDTYTVLISGEQTAGAYTLIDMIIPPGGGPGPHRHDFEELFLITEGELVFTFRDEPRTVTSGHVVNIPANAPHFFHNDGTTPARMLCLCAPAGQEEFFACVSDALPSRTSTAPTLDGDALAARLALMGRLAPAYRTELIKP